MKYQNIYFAQEHEAEKALGILTEFGEEEVINYLIQFDYNDSPIEEINGTPWGSYDEKYTKDNYVLTYDTRMGYIGLTKIIKED